MNLHLHLLPIICFLVSWSVSTAIYFFAYNRQRGRTTFYREKWQASEDARLQEYEKLADLIQRVVYHKKCVRESSAALAEIAHKMKELDIILDSDLRDTIRHSAQKSLFWSEQADATFLDIGNKLDELKDFAMNESRRRLAT